MDKSLLKKCFDIPQGILQLGTIEILAQYTEPNIYQIFSQYSRSKGILFVRKCAFHL